MDFMDLIYAAFVGWCGTGWTIIRWPRPWPGPGPRPDPGPLERLRSNPGDFYFPADDAPGPYNPWERRVIGAIAGTIIVYTMGTHFSGAGMWGITMPAFFGGSCAADAVTGVIGLFRRKPAIRADIRGQSS